MASDSAEHVLNQVDWFSHYTGAHSALSILLPYTTQDSIVWTAGYGVAINVEGDEGSIKICLFSVMIEDDNVF